MRDDLQTGWVAEKRHLSLPNGVRLAIWEQDGSAPTILFLHGFSDSSRSFSRLVPFLPGMRLIAPDLRGHGGTAVPEGLQLSIEGMAEDMHMLLSQLAGPPVTVVGHSMGAMVAMMLAARHPQLVRNLVLISAVPRVPFDDGHPVVGAINGLRDPINPAQAFFDDWHEGIAGIDPAFARLISTEACCMPSAVWREVLQALRLADLRDMVSSIAMPVLLASGGADRLFSLDDQHVLMNLVADIRQRVFPPLGHNPHWEEPALMAREISDFIKQTPDAMMAPAPAASALRPRSSA